MANEEETVSSPNAEPQRSKLATAAAPVIFGLVIAVVVVLAVLVAVTFQKVSDLEDDNSALIAVLDTNFAQLQQSDLQQRTVSYWLAYPSSETLVLNTPFEGGIAQGLLKPAETGQSAILLVAGLGELPPSSIYDIWLSEGDRSILAGEIVLDAAGWGTSSVYFDEPLSSFDSVELTLRVQENTTSRAGAGPTVLEGNIP